MNSLSPRPLPVMRIASPSRRGMASEADLSPEQKLFTRAVQQFPPRQGLVAYLRGVKPSPGTWFDLAITVASGLIWLGTIFALGLFAWMHTR